jgi:beta-fructofuranosidase
MDPALIPPLPRAWPPAPQDVHRPRTHFTAPQGWLNDPNGVCFHGGRWHVFYQHNPREPRWGGIHWGHASSPDLRHWTDEPLALAPGAPGEVDVDGCFSGSFALVNGTPTLHYTGFTWARQVQCVATSEDPDLRRWTKRPERTIHQPPEGVGGTDFRDPYVFRHDGVWWMVVGGSIRSERGIVLLYRSEDGVRWAGQPPLFTAPRLDQGVLWECPNFFPLPEADGVHRGRWVLTVSVWPNLSALAFTGRFEGGRFLPEHEQVLDPDGGAFAHLAAPAPDGRMLQWAWLCEQREQAAVDADGWAGALSWPRELGLDARGRLSLRPAREMAAHRGAALPLTPVATGPDARGDRWRLDGGRAVDLELRVTRRDRLRCGLTLAASPCGSESTRVFFWPDARRLVIERARSSINPQASRQNLWTHLELADDEVLDLRVVLDHSVLEVFANGRCALATRLYPALATSTRVAAWADGDADLALSAWTLETPDARTPR